MTIKKILLNILEKSLKFFSIYVLYSSVLASILFPMLLISGIFVFFLAFYDISWYLADPSIFSKALQVCWLNSYLDISFFFTDNWRYVKAMIFVIGLILFIISLAHLVIGIRKNSGLVQNRIYKHIRHPQNLSIIIMAFPLFLLHGFRLGDFVSWVQFIFIMIIYSDIGDIKLKKKVVYIFNSHCIK